MATSYDIFYNPLEDVGYKVWTMDDGSIEAHGEHGVHRFDNDDAFIRWVKDYGLEYGGTEQY